MSLLTDTRNFFVKERVWSVLFLFVIVSYVLILLWKQSSEEQSTSPAVEKLQAAEKRLMQEIRAQGGIEQILARKPKLFLAFNLFSFFLMVGIVGGIIIDFLWVSRPQWRTGLLTIHGPPQARGWTLSTIFKVILLFFLITLSLNIVLSFLRYATRSSISPNFFLLFHTTLSDILCIALVVYFVHRAGGNWRDLGFHEIRILKDIRVGLVGYLAILPFFLLILVAVVLWASIFHYEPPPHPLVEVFLEEEARSPALIAYSIFLACVTGPFLEEIFFRGFLYPALKSRWGVTWGLILSSAFFGLIHQNTFAFLPIFLLGLILGYLYEKRGTLVPSIALHIVHNSVFVAYFFLAKEVLMNS
ncbi:MAG: CPBP family intramembrane metalloprotease [Candidatus Omnitrophica bacterium]|nr:CPBP family intramembrane metalloprotease [Candidatus Omnitrophota bacterium]